MLKRWIEKALTKTVVTPVQNNRSKKRQRISKLETVEVPPSVKLVYGVYFMMMLFAGLSAIQIVHLIVLRSFNSEIFQLMNSVASVMIGVFFGAKL